jgi:4-amino-4-deoxy-L-arabinose transferase-like glycosyltransferase
MSLSTPLAMPTAATSSSGEHTRSDARWFDLALPLGLALGAFVIRLPYLWTIPRFTDETREALRAIDLLRGDLRGADRLVNVDAYIGSIYTWLLAAIFWLTGVSAYTPRLVVAVAGAIAVGFTYLLARDLAGRTAGLIAAGLLATSGGIILSNSHIAWSHCLTPTLTTLAAFLLQRAVRSESRPALLGAGLAFGVAFQTHPATLVLLPGAAIYILWWGRRWLRTPWPYLALGLFLLGFANMLAYNLMTGGGSFKDAAEIRDHYSNGRELLTGLSTYLANHAIHDLMLLRYLAGAVDSRENAASDLLDPTLWIYGGLSVAGLVWCARRGAPLLLLMTLSSILIMPYFNDKKYVPISDGRYLMPLLPLAFASIGAILARVHPSPPGGLPWSLSAAPPLHGPLSRRQERGSRSGAAVRFAWAAGVLLLVLYPLVPLARYYDQETAAGRTNAPLFQAVDAALAARRPGEAVLLDQDLSDLKFEGGGTAFRSLRLLLAGNSVPSPSIDTIRDYGRRMNPGTTALYMMDARSFGSFDADLAQLRSVGVTGQAVSAPPGPDGFGIYRLERQGSIAWSAPAGPRGFPVYMSLSPSTTTTTDGIPDQASRLTLSPTSGEAVGGQSLLQQFNEMVGQMGHVFAAAPPDDATVQQADAKITGTVPVEQFVTDLINPRGLAFRSDGSLFVALAGAGGPNSVDVGREKPQTYGRTGQIVRIEADGSKFLMAKDLPSIVTAVNEECGPTAIAFIDDKTYFLSAAGGWDIGDPDYHSGVYELRSDGSTRRVWDMTEYVLAHPARARREDPRADVPAGMAYGMTALGGKLYVTDANQEQLFEIDPNSGEARQVMEYPKSNRAMMGIAPGPDNALYVAEWASNKVTRIGTDGSISDGATKLRTPSGVTFGEDGSMYVVEFTGRVLRAEPVGQDQKDILVEGLRAATAIAYGPDGNLYVSVYGQGAAEGQGEIVRVRLAPPSATEQLNQTMRGVEWAGGLVVLVVLLGISWKHRVKTPSR